MNMKCLRGRISRGLLLLATTAVMFQTTSGCDDVTVRNAFLGSVQQFVTSLVGAFFAGLESQGSFTPVTV